MRHPWLAQIPGAASLDDQTRILTFIAGNTASGNLTALARDWCYLDEANHANGMEVIMQSYIYCGAAKVLNAFAAVSELGIADRTVIDRLPPTKEDYQKWTEKGICMMKTLYAHKYDAFRHKAQFLSPVLDNWLTNFVYGRILSRPVLSIRERQLCALAASVGHIVWPQFRSAIMVCLNVGATLEEVRSVLDSTALIHGPTAQVMVDGLWTELNKRRLLSKGTRMNQSFNITRGPVRQPKRRHPFLERLRDDLALDDTTCILALLAANCAAGNLTGVARDWSFLPVEHHTMGIETILQNVVYAGFQKVINALEVVHRTGLDPALLHPEVFTESPVEIFWERGYKQLLAVYAKQTERLKERVRSWHPDVEGHMHEFLYGRVQSRALLDTKRRELCAIAALAGQIVFPQFHSHLLGALNTGSTLEEIRVILDLVEQVYGPENQAKIDGYWLGFVSTLQRT